MPDAFCLAGYRSLLRDFAARGYEVRGYDDAQPDRPHLILRHDIDMSLDAALPVAEIERELGVKSYYFVLVRSEMYNPWSSRSGTALLRLRGLGHEVGLHLDASLYGNETAAIEEGARTESAALEKITGAPVRFISFHRPVKELLGRAGTLADRRHAYEPRFFSEMGYCSDSRGVWHHGAPLNHPAIREGRALQLLTHPIWWVAGGVDGAVAKLEKFLDDRVHLLQSELADNCEPYRAALKNHPGKTPPG